MQRRRKVVSIFMLPCPSNPSLSTLQAIGASVSCRRRCLTCHSILSLNGPPRVRNVVSGTCWLGIQQSPRPRTSQDSAMASSLPGPSSSCQTWTVPAIRAMPPVRRAQACPVDHRAGRASFDQQLEGTVVLRHHSPASTRIEVRQDATRVDSGQVAPLDRGLLNGRRGPFAGGNPTSCDG